jgi:8-oxo-dGTP diphosphatase
MESKIQATRVGIGILVFKEGKILLGKRKSLHGEGQYSAPGGHLEYLESFEECAIRETMEECGVKIKNLRFVHVANILHYEPKHYINICLYADWESGEPKVLEPEKAESWDWYDPDNLPEPMFIQTKLGLDNFKSGNHFNDKVK